jgi:hypothetical protein
MERRELIIKSEHRAAFALIVAAIGTVAIITLLVFAMP